MNFYEDQKEVVVRTFISHKLYVMHTFQKKWKKNTCVVGSFIFSSVVCSICSIYSLCLTAICKFNRTL